MIPQPQPNRLDWQFWLGAAFVLAYFVYWTAEGLRCYFAPDDLLGEYYVWSRPLWKLIAANLFPFTNYYRPLGSAWYYMLFSIAGFHPLPFHLFAYALLILNLWLVFCFTTRLSGSREIGGLATLLGSVHAEFADLYFSTGPIYDIIACCLYLTASLYYLRIRQSGRTLSWKNIGWLVVLTLLAMNAKEMAATLPLMLGVYELIFHPPRMPLRSSAVARQLRPILVLAAAVLLSAFAKTRPGYDNPITGQLSYHWTITWRQYLSTTSAYLNNLFYTVDKFTPFPAALFLLLLLALAWAFHSRPMLYAYCFFLFTSLPISFIPARAGFAQLIPMIGMSLYVAALLIELRDGLLRVLPSAGSARRTVLARSPFVLFAGFVLAYAPMLRQHFDDFTPQITNKEEIMRASFGQIRSLCPTLPKGTRILFLDDRFDTDEYTLLIFLRLYYKDIEIIADRAKVTPELAQQQSSYDKVFSLKDGSEAED